MTEIIGNGLTMIGLMFYFIMSPFIEPKLNFESVEKIWRGIQLTIFNGFIFEAAGISLEVATDDLPFQRQSTNDNLYISDILQTSPHSTQVMSV